MMRTANRFAAGPRLVLLAALLAAALISCESMLICESEQSLKNPPCLIKCGGSNYCLSPLTKMYRCPSAIVQNCDGVVASVCASIDVPCNGTQGVMACKNGAVPLLTWDSVVIERVQSFSSGVYLVFESKNLTSNTFMLEVYIRNSHFSSDNATCNGEFDDHCVMEVSMIHSTVCDEWGYMKLLFLLVGVPVICMCITVGTCMGCLCKYYKRPSGSERERTHILQQD